ncbi:hypothetical protein [Streptomyces sp. NPDC046939]|uniref:hypothetical protein n=1 Tax=Streptomyces sp. NPDC046939 TaxID=3155376 RepID=UPI0033F7D1D2
MLVVALLLLPVMGLLMIAMDRIEDLLNEETRPATGRRVRHPRLVPVGRRASRDRTPPSGHHATAA